MLNGQSGPLLSLQDFTLRRGPHAVLDAVTLTLGPGRTLGLLGESGAGKSTLAMALIGLLRPPEVELFGSMVFAGTELVGLPEAQYRALRGNRIGLVFQDATASLDPCFTVGQQICEPLKRHLGLGSREAAARAIELLTQVGIPDARSRLNAYPHQLSGGMQQRVMISIALACNPQLLIADEPTSALDVTIQAQIMELILLQVRASGSSAIFVLHDLALAAQVCDDIAVLYAGQLVETGPATAVLGTPKHPYTIGLRSCVVELDSELLKPLVGSVPSLNEMPDGCHFCTRCPHAIPRCFKERPPLIAYQGRAVACWLIADLPTSAAVPTPAPISAPTPVGAGAP
jgi:oligopeptide/dipeptide ABC transporter ATP-binding protein